MEHMGRSDFGSINTITFARFPQESEQLTHSKQLATATKTAS